MTTLCLRASSDTPLLYFYGELDPRALADFEQHLGSCDACAAAVAELEQLRVALQGRSAITRTPREWDAFMQRLDAALDGRQEARGAMRPFGGAPWLALAAALLVGVGLGLFWQQRVLGPGDARVGDAAASVTALDAAAARHFERAKIVVLGLAMKDPASATPRDWEYERTLAASLLPETRLFRLSAADRGDPTLAGLLGDLEAVLLQAAMTADADAPELERIQRIIRGRDLIVRMDLRDTHMTTRGI